MVFAKYRWAHLFLPQGISDKPNVCKNNKFSHINITEIIVYKVQSKISK